MAADADRILHQIIDRQIKAGNFTTGSAAGAAFGPIAKLDNLKPIDIPNLRPIIMDGLKHRAKQYQPSVNKAAEAHSKAEDDEQSDFREVDDDFSRILYQPVAMDETEGAVRLPPIEMTLSQIRMHIALKRRKAGQTWRTADYLDRLVTRYLNQWSAEPEKTLRQLLADSEKDAA